MPIGCKSRRKLITTNEAKRSRHWWRNSTTGLNSVLHTAWFDKLGLPRLS
jgi:hypothetical protein